MPAQILFQLYMLSIHVPRLVFSCFTSVFILNFSFGSQTSRTSMDAQLCPVRPCHPTDHCSAQDSALSGLLPQWFYPARLYFPSCLPNTVIPVCIISSHCADFSLVLLLLFLLPITLSFYHLHPLFIPVSFPVSALLFYSLIWGSHLIVLPERLPAHPSPSLRTFFHSNSLPTLLFQLSIPISSQHLFQSSLNRSIFYPLLVYLIPCICHTPFSVSNLQCLFHFNSQLNFSALTSVFSGEGNWGHRREKPCF